MNRNHTHPKPLSASAIAAAFFAMSVNAHAGPSFDCGRATADDEIAICSSSHLSELDNLMAAGFQFLKLHSGKKQANRIARPLLGMRQACGGDAGCIQQRQIDAVRAYQQRGAPIRLPDWASSSTPAAATGNDMPQSVGACITSNIADFGGRLEGDENFDSGTGVRFSNGGSQVSYEKEPGIIGSKVGDPVRICLVSIPKGCPPGDVRGKVYRTTNQRTGESWQLPDSQHMCGGA